MRTAYLLTFLVISCFFVNVTLKALFSVRAKSIKCYCNLKYFNNCTCKVKAVKGKLGILYGDASIRKPIDNVFVGFTIYYRYGTIYRQYLINREKIDICQLLRLEGPYTTHPVAMLLYAMMNKFYPKLLQGCPYIGTWIFKDIDCNATITPFMPPIIPRGTYKAFGRAFLNDNETIGWVEFIAEVLPNFNSRAVDFSMLGMG